MNPIYGNYKRSVDAIEYEYDATWRGSSDGLTWNATVHTDGQRLSFPMGTLRGADAAGGESGVHGAIERAIEAARVPALRECGVHDERRKRREAEHCQIIGNPRG